MRRPLVGVVVVNYNGGDLTLRCLESLRGLEWPDDRLRVVLVDNASADGVAERVAGEHPRVEIVRSPTNLGFAGGCNAGIRQLRGVDHVALLNSDAVADRNWLAPLVDAVEADSGLGAACSKVLFDGRFVDVSLACATSVPGRGDRRELGVRVCGARVDGADVWRRTQFVRGFWGPELAVDGTAYQWSSGHAALRLPEGSGAQLLLSAGREKVVALLSGTDRREYEVGPAARWVDAPFAGDAVDVVNSAGGQLVDGGYGADRGYLDVDDGRYDDDVEVFAWSGAAVLLAGRYLASVGVFEDRYFLYYEDFDLSWRGRLAGWSYRCVPASVVRHVHSASTVEGSPLFRHHVERNRLLTLTRNAPASLAAGAPGRSALITLSYTRRDVAAPVLHGRRPRPDIPRWRTRALLAYLRMAPWALRSRRRIRGAAKVADEEILRWMEAGEDPVVGSKG